MKKMACLFKNTGYLRTIHFYFLLYKNTKMRIQQIELFFFSLVSHSPQVHPLRLSRAEQFERALVSF